MLDAAASWTDDAARELECLECTVTFYPTVWARGKAVRVIHELGCPWFRRWVAGKVPCPRLEGWIVLPRGPYKRKSLPENGATWQKR